MKETSVHEDHLVWIIATIGAFALAAVFLRMKDGFGPYNLRAFGIVLVATFVTLLALHSDTNLTAAMGILGAIAGYLFSIKSDQAGQNRKSVDNKNGES
jgi:hypothetical protein